MDLPCSDVARKLYSGVSSHWSIAIGFHFRPFSGAFAKLRKLTVSLILSICLSAWSNCDPTERIFMKFNIWVFLEAGGRHSSVSTATRYGLDGPGIESQWECIIFRTRPDLLWGPPSLLYNVYRVFPGIKRPGRGVGHPTPSSAEVKERVQLYLYSPSGTSLPVVGRILSLPLPYVTDFETANHWTT